MSGTHQIDGVVSAATAVGLGHGAGCPTLAVSIAGLTPQLAIIRVRGDLDCATADLLTAVLADQRAAGRRFLRLDLSELEFLDCAGLAALVHAHHLALASRGTLVLTGLRPHAARLLSLTGLDTVLCLADGVADPRHVRDLVNKPGQPSRAS